MPHVSPVIRDQILLGDRWTPLRHHPVQQLLWNCGARFVVAPAGRRSGKTEIAKRKIVKEAMRFSSHPDGWFILSAPTHAQAKRIYWNDIKRMVPDWCVQRVFETDMTVRLITGTEITVMGMDQPERAEGRPLDGIILDEYADMKPIVWTRHVRPALSTIGRLGWAWFVGTPEGRNHFYELFTSASANEDGSWAAFTWKSSELLDPEEIESAKKDLDRLSFMQEYEASFVNFEGRVYYGFDRAIHAKHRILYDPRRPLIFTFDFNVKPGVAAVIQELELDPKKFKTRGPVTCVIGEVYIPDNSNTPMVCRKLVYDWGHHKGDVLCYGDASGGARGSARVSGSDWELVKKTLSPEFGDKLKFRYRRQNPKERSRVNAVNSRIQSADGVNHLFVDSSKAPHVVKDLEGVKFVEGGAGEIDKFSDPMLTHISDAVGYYVEKAFPVEGQGAIDSSEVA